MIFKITKYSLFYLFVQYVFITSGFAQSLEFADDVRLVDHPDNDPTFYDAFMPLDHNVDSIVDLVGHDGYRTIMLTGMGDGEYSEQSFERYFALKVMDFDRDGIRDDIVTQEHIHIRSDSGTYYTLNPQIGSFETMYEAADFDDNGYTDLVTLYNEGNSAKHLEIYFNDGDSSFTKQRLYKEDPINDIDFGDVDADGDLDIVLSQKQGAKGAVLINDGNGNFQKHLISPGAGIGRRNIDLNDMDGDGDLDLIMLSSDKIVVFENTDTLSSFGSFTEISNLINNTILHLEDFNNDDLPDIIVRHYNLNQEVGQLSAFANQGNLNFGKRNVLLQYEYIGGNVPPTPYKENLLSTFDVDFDGDQDIVFTNIHIKNEITLIENLHIDIPTAVDYPSNVAIHQIDVSPNPAGDYIRLHIPGQIGAANLQYRIFSRTQELVQQGKLQGSLTLHLDPLPNGLYYVLVWNAERQRSYFSEFVKSE